MGYRLSGFDYTRPFFYMVTLKRLPGLRPLSEIVAPGRCRMNAVTRAIVNAIRNFHRECPGGAPIERFTIMPDHVHALVRIAEDGKRPSFLAVVPRLTAVLSGRYAEVTGEAGKVFDPDWHDWIVPRASFQCNRGEENLELYTKYCSLIPSSRHHVPSAVILPIFCELV